MIFLDLMVDEKFLRWLKKATFGSPRCAVTPFLSGTWHPASWGISACDMNQDSYARGLIDVVRHDPTMPGATVYCQDSPSSFEWHSGGWDDWFNVYEHLVILERYWSSKRQVCHRSSLAARWKNIQYTNVQKAISSRVLLSFDQNPAEKSHFTQKIKWLVWWLVWEAFSALTFWFFSWSFWSRSRRSFNLGYGAIVMGIPQ